MQQAVLPKVKVYKYNEEGNWDDKGTGFVSIQRMQQSEAMGLVVVAQSEETRTLLIHKLGRAESYNRQGGESEGPDEATIITWNDPELRTDIALSFQEAKGCSEIWDQIQQIQQESRHHADAHRGRGRAGPHVDEYDQVVAQADDADLRRAGSYGYREMDGPTVELPAPEMKNLGDIAQVMTLRYVNPYHREEVAHQLMRPGYLSALLDLFRQCEDLEDVSSLHHIYRIVVACIMLNDTQILEELLREGHVMDVVGALEYDPDCGAARQRHRDFLRDVHFKEVVPITDPELRAKIHQTYRINYIKDVILPRSLDDSTYATLSSVALFNNVDVVTSLQQHPDFLPELFRRLKGQSPRSADWHDLVAFLQELCGLAKHLQAPARQALLKRLITLGLFEVSSKIMKYSDEDARLRAADILISVAQHDPEALRQFLSAQPDTDLLGILVRELLRCTDSGLPEQAAELLKLLLDPESMESGITRGEDKFLAAFYDKYIDKLVEEVAAESSVSNISKAHMLGVILELLCFCVQHHSYRIKYYILRQNVIGRVLQLVRSKQKWLVVAAIRFFRTCLGTKDEFYTKYIIRNNLFEPVMTVFFENGPRYNLLNSVVLELLEYIRSQNMKGVMEHVVQRYGHLFEEVEYVATFKDFLLRHEQLQERSPDARPGAGTITAAAAAQQDAGRRRRRDERDLERGEEDYFSEDADDDDTHPSTSAPSPTGAHRASPRPRNMYSQRSGPGSMDASGRGRIYGAGGGGGSTAASGGGGGGGGGAAVNGNFVASQAGATTTNNSDALSWQSSLAQYGDDDT